MTTKRTTPLPAADDLSRRLVSVFLDDSSDRRPVFGDTELFQADRAWHDHLPFHEYFHGAPDAASAPPTRPAGPASSPTSSCSLED
jgi:hypothetical protein